MVREVEWMGSFPPDSEQPETALSADRQRTLRAFPYYEQGARIALALSRARGIPGSAEKVRFLRKNVNAANSEVRYAF